MCSGSDVAVVVIRTYEANCRFRIVDTISDLVQDNNSQNKCDPEQGQRTSSGSFFCDINTENICVNPLRVAIYDMKHDSSAI